MNNGDAATIFAVEMPGQAELVSPDSRLGAFGIDKALEGVSEIRCSGSDPEVVRACLKRFRQKGYELDRDPMEIASTRT